MNILDNNVISELWKPQPSGTVVEWLENNEWFLPAPVLAEIQEGAEALPSAARRAELNAKIDEVVSDYSEALLDWDAETARTVCAIHRKSNAGLSRCGTACLMP